MTEMVLSDAKGCGKANQHMASLVVGKRKAIENKKLCFPESCTSHSNSLRSVVLADWIETLSRLLIDGTQSV